MNNVQAIIQAVPGLTMNAVTENTIFMANLTEYASLTRSTLATLTPHGKNLNNRTLSHSTQARHRCELARASTITGTPRQEIARTWISFGRVG